MDSSNDESSPEKNRTAKMARLTHIKFQEYQYEWHIENVVQCSKPTGEYLESFFDTDEYSWGLMVYPNGTQSSSSEYLDVGIRLCQHTLSTNEFEDALVEFSILIEERRQVNVWKRLIKKQDFSEGDGVIVCASYFRKKEFSGKNNKWILNNNLILLFKITLNRGFDDREIVSTDRDIARAINTPDSVTADIPAERRLIEFDDFEKLFESQKFSDVTLVVKDKEFPVHKAILSARSRVFAAMFEHDMKEQKENKVVIVDIDVEVMQEALRFMYVGKANDIRTLGRELLMAAEKYDLEGLKVVCEQVLIEDLNDGNLGDLLKLVDKCATANKLKQAAIDYWTEHRKDLKKSDDFKAVFKSLSPQLLAEVIDAFMDKL